MRDQKKVDDETAIIKAVRDVMKTEKANMMNIGDILKKVQKGIYSTLNLDREKLTQVLDHYKNLQVVYIDNDQNVLFL